MSEWIPVISTLAGGFIGIVGGYVTGAAQSRRQQQTEKRKFLLGKLEETYETAAKVRAGFKRVLGASIMRLTFDQEPTQEGQSSAGSPIEHISMYVNLYFNDLKPYFDEFVESRDRLGEYFADSITKRNASESERMQLKGEMIKVFEHADRVCNEFLEATSNLVKEFL